MSTNEENLKIVLASTSGETGYYRIPVEDANKLAKGETSTLWCTYVVRDDGETLVTAITGDGPDSEANAKFFAGARGFALSLIEKERTAATLLLETLDNQIALPPGLRHRIRDFLGLQFEPTKCA